MGDTQKRPFPEGETMLAKALREDRAWRRELDTVGWSG